jgi:hypothetical protein
MIVYFFYGFMNLFGYWVNVLNAGVNWAELEDWLNLKE